MPPNVRVDDTPAAERVVRVADDEAVAPDRRRPAPSAAPAPTPPRPAEPTRGRAAAAALNLCRAGVERHREIVPRSAAQVAHRPQAHVDRRRRLQPARAPSPPCRAQLIHRQARQVHCSAPARRGRLNLPSMRSGAREHVNCSAPGCTSTSCPSAARRPSACR